MAEVTIHLPGYLSLALERSYSHAESSRGSLYVRWKSGWKPQFYGTAEDSHSGTVSAPHDEQSRICERLWDPRLSAL